ncbi:MAG: ABC transporter permease [Aminipila sp.]
MYKYILKRLWQLLVVLVGITFFTFLLLHISPGDPAYNLLSEGGVPPSKELLELTREQMGLNDPFLKQYLSWLLNAIQGDFGISYNANVPALELFLRELPKTLTLAVSGFLVAVFISFPLGLLSAVKANRIEDQIINLYSIISISIPNFYLALIFMFIFGIKLKWLPVMGSEGFKSVIIPATVLGIVTSGILIKQIRAAVLEELNKDYVKGAKARGLSGRIILVNNILKNAMLSIITAMGINFGHLLGGTAAIEILLMYRGVSSLAIHSIAHRDYPVIQVYVVWMAMMFCCINFLVDISYQYFNPKIRLKENK